MEDRLSSRSISHLQGRDARCRSEPSACDGLACRIRHAFRARLWCCSVYQIGAYSSSSSNDSENASATISNCESSDFLPPLRGRDFPSKGRGTILLPSHSLGSLCCGDEAGGWSREVCSTQMNFATLNRFIILFAGGHDVGACPRPIIAVFHLFDWYSNTENNSPACLPAVLQDSCGRPAKLS